MLEWGQAVLRAFFYILTSCWVSFPLNKRIFNSSPLHSPHHHNYSSAAAPANLNDDEESDGVDVDVLGEAEEKGENSGEDHPQRQEVSEVDSLRDVAAENKNKISESGYEPRTFGQFLKQYEQ